jgi:hypothetical protein
VGTVSCRCSIPIYGSDSRTWTDTVLPPADFLTTLCYHSRVTAL